LITLLKRVLLGQMLETADVAVLPHLC